MLYGKDSLPPLPPRECQTHVPTNHPFIPKDHDLIDCATTPWLIRDIRTTHVMAGEGQPQISARLAGTQNTARDSARLARSASVPAFSSRGAQLSARYSTRKSTGRRSGSRRSLQNTARSSLDTTRSAALRVTLGYTERRPKDQAKSKVDPLWWYNPQRSKKAPLKSTFVDPQQAAKLRNHKTQTELRRTIKRSTIPHISYDIDGDGVVNQSDMQVARWIDVDGKGTLTYDEREEGQQLLARRFLEYNKGQRWLKNVAPQFAGDDVDKAALDVANSEDFARTMFLLRQAAKPGNGRAGRGAIACLDEAYKNGWGPDPGDNDPLIKTLVPTARGTGNMRRAKSRSELFESRKQAQLQLASTYEPYKGNVPTTKFRRVTLMTSPKAWNRCNNTTKHLCQQVYEVEKEAALRKTMENNGTSVVETATARERRLRPKIHLKFPEPEVG